MYFRSYRYNGIKVEISISDFVKHSSSHEGGFGRRGNDGFKKFF